MYLLVDVKLYVRQICIFSGVLWELGNCLLTGVEKSLSELFMYCL